MLLGASLRCPHVSVPLCDFPGMVLPAAVAWSWWDSWQGCVFLKYESVAVNLKKGSYPYHAAAVWNSSEQWKRQWSCLQKRRSWCQVRFGSLFQLNSIKRQILLFFFRWRRKLFMPQISHEKLPIASWEPTWGICHTLSRSSKVLLDAGNQSIIVLNCQHQYLTQNTCNSQATVLRWAHCKLKTQCFYSDSRIYSTDYSCYWLP